jgi:energy-coupling factor transporter ATP-binding protein EcfA2
VLSTHLIDEVSDLIEHVILIDKGRIVLDEDTDAPREGAVVVITLQKWWPDIGHWFADAPRSVPMVWLPALVAAAGIVAAWALVRRATA